MGLSRQQVEQHIAGVQKRLSSETERKQHGYLFAKLCFQVKSYEDAIRYLSEYLAVQEKDAKAQKLMGRLYEAVGDLEKAIAHYKRSLDLKKGQRDVLFSVAELYCRLDKPPVEAVKQCLQQIQSISETHPLILSLSEKLQSLQGMLDTCTVEDLIAKHLAVSSRDADLHIRLVKLYARSGKLPEAFQYCQVLNVKKQFTDSIHWHSCALETAERFYEALRTSGSEVSKQLMEVLVAILEAIMSVFGLLVGTEQGALSQCASLLLKFDLVLLATVSKLQTLEMEVHRDALRELGGQFYLMLAEYLYLCAHRMKKQSVMGKSSQLFQLGDFCLLTSMKATPPRGQGPSSQKWRAAACRRLSIVGRHMMVVAARKGEHYFQELPKHIESQGGKLYLIRTIFSENQDITSTTVLFGSQKITYSLQQSFLDADKPLSGIPSIPSHEDLCDCDQVYIADNVRSLRGLIWLCLVFKALDMPPLVADWLSLLFDNLQLEAHDLRQHGADSLCLCDLEAFLVLSTQQCETHLTSPYSGYKLYSSPTPSTPLNSILVQHLPCCLMLGPSGVSADWWEGIISLLSENVSVQEGVTLKKEVQAGLRQLRGCSPLQLNLTQLATLARHFKQRAESILKSTEDCSWNYRDVVLALLKRSNHYWEIIVSVLGGASKIEQRKKLLGNVASPLSTAKSTAEDTDTAGLVEEAQMALANIALYKKDSVKALRIYSRVKTPHAAWNQCQIYRMLAEQGKMETPKDANARISNLEKALEALTMAISRLSPSEDSSLREKLLVQKEEVKQLLGDTKMSPVACELKYGSPEDSPLAPRHSSTPNTSDKGIPDGLSDSLRDSLRRKDEQIVAMNQHLQRLQAEMDELKKASFLATPTSSTTTPKQLTPPPVAVLQTSSITSPGQLVGATASSPVERNTSRDSPSFGRTPLQHFPPGSSKQELMPALQTIPACQQYDIPPAAQSQLVNPAMLSPHMVVQSSTSTAYKVPSPLMTAAFPPRTSPAYGMVPPLSFQQPPKVQESPGFTLAQTVPFKPAPTLPSYFQQYQPSGEQIPKMPSFQPPETHTAPLKPQEPAVMHLSGPAPWLSPQAGMPRLFSPWSSVSFITPQPASAKPMNISPGVFPSAYPPLDSQQHKPQNSSLAAPLQYYDDLPTSTAPGSTTAPPEVMFPSETPDLCSQGFSQDFQPRFAPFNPPVPTTATASPQFSLASLPQFGSSGVATKPQPGFPTSGVGTSPFQFRLAPFSSSGVTGGLPISTAPATTTATASSASFAVPTTFPLLSSLLSSGTIPTSQSSLLSFPQSSEKPIPVGSSGFSFKLPDLSGLETTDKPSINKPSLTSSASLNSLGKSLFTTPATNTKKVSIKLPEVEVEGSESEGEDGEKHDQSLDTSGGPHYVPIVSLPKLAEIKSGEEEEEVLFSHRAKLYRFDAGVKQWKERGIGDMKILQHRENGRVRLVMRREQVLKLCCNHYLTPEMNLTAIKGNNQLAWFTPCDFADGVAKPEKLAIKFKQSGTAQDFKDVFEGCVAELLEQASEGEENSIVQEKEHSVSAVTASPVNLDTSKSLLSKFTPPPGSWDCKTCLVLNTPASVKCAACGMCKPDQPSETGNQIFPPALPQTGDSLASMFAPPIGSWNCEACMLQNNPSAVKCMACGTSKAGQPSLLPSSGTTSASVVTAPPFTSFIASAASQPSGGFKLSGGTQPPSIFSKFALPGSWTCASCYVQNHPGVQKCVACSREKGEPKTAVATISTNPVLQASASMFTQPSLLPTTQPQILMAMNKDPSQTQPMGGIKIESLQSVSLQSMAAKSVQLTHQETGRPEFEGFKFTASLPTGSSFSSKLPTTVTKVGGEGGAEDELNVSLEHEPEVYFKPVVILPKSVEIKTGEEEEEVVFSHKAKLYRFDMKAEQWKDRGVGDMKILKHKQSGKARLLMRREQILKVCCNHYLTADMSLTPHNNSDKAWTWYTPSDFADEVPKPERLTLRFKLPEVAQQFKVAFDGCISSISVPEQPTSPAKDKRFENHPKPAEILASKFAPLPGSWDCDTCLVQNKPQDSKCAACGTSKPCGSSEPPDKVSEGTAPCLPTDVTDKAAAVHTLSIPPATEKKVEESDSEVNVSDDVEITAVEMPPQEKLDLARKYMLPLTFYNYENKPPCPGCRGCDDQTDHDYQSTDSVDPDKEEEQPSTESEVSTSMDPGRVPESATKWKPFAGLFSSAPSLSSFADIAASGSTGSFMFGETATNSEGFSRAGEVLFSAKTEPLGNESYNPEAETDVHFKPLVSLPKVIVKTGEEDEEVLFSHRAKLYRFDSTVRQWKERGVGDIKILHSQSTSKTRVLMRRDQILKLCCNHLITENMNIVPTAGSDKSLTWYTPCDFADEVAKPEKLSVKFKLPETAREFKKVFDLCAATSLLGTDTEQGEMERQNSNEQGSTFEKKERSPVPVKSPMLKLTPPPGSWCCETCLVSNSPSNNRCAACGAANPAIDEEPHDGEEDEESHEGDDEEPHDGEDEEPHDEEDEEPHDGETDEEPHDGETDEEPHDGEADEEPHDGEADEEPHDGEADEEPHDGEADEEPHDGETDEEPHDGEADEEPHDGEADEEPHDGEAGEEPHDREDEEPHDGEDEQPHDREDEEPHDREDEEPHDGEDEQPHDGEEDEESHKSETMRSPLKFPLEFSSPPPQGHSDHRPPVVTSATSPLRFPLGLGPHMSPPTPASEPSSPEQEEEEDGGEKTDLLSPENLGFTPKPFDMDHLEAKTDDVTSETDLCSVGNNDVETFSHCGKLMYQDITSKEWKVKGNGVMKIVKHMPTQKQRIIMLSNHPTSSVLCAHFITTLMHLRSTPAKENAWVWCTPEDYSSGDLIRETRNFCIEFDSPQAAEDFQRAFVASAGPSSALLGATYKGEETPSPTGKESQEDPLCPCSPLAPAPTTDDVTFLFEEFPDQALIEKAEALMLPRSFYLYEKKPACSGCRGCRDESGFEDVATDDVANSTVPSPPESAEAHQDPTSESITSSGLHFHSGGMVSFSDLLSKSSDGFGQKSASFMFQGTGQQLFSSRGEEENANPEAEADIHFRPIITLPEAYTLTSWDDNAETLFSHRARLYRFDGSSYQWKERGVGDMKILKHRQTKKVRLIMRRDQILKICCNHQITADMHLNGTSERTWVWFSPSDYSDETPKPEKLQIRFKYGETAQAFKKVFDECVRELQSQESTLEDVHQAPQEVDESLVSKFKPSAGSWTCDVCFVSNTAEATKCVACDCLKDGSTLSHAGDKSLDSTPKPEEPTLPVTIGSAGGIKLDILQCNPLQQQQSASTEYKPISLSGQATFGSGDAASDVNTMQGT